MDSRYATSVALEKAVKSDDEFSLADLLDEDPDPPVQKQMIQDWEALWKALPEVDGKFIRSTREKFECSRALFARRLCMNERTLEKWEQGRAKPNAQAAVLMLLVHHYPDTLERLRRIASPDPMRRRRTR
jgi:DNA-binding transcriptional regulator YiaG